MSYETKKRYVFVISRCLSSISAAVTLLILRCILYVYFPPETSSYYLYAVVIIADDISFYSLQGSYIGMAILLYIGVLHPVYFSRRLTLRKVYILAISNVILAILISFPCGAYQTATYIPGPIECGSQHCAPVVGLINFIIVSIAFSLTILILLFVFIRLSFHIHQAKKLGSYTSSQTLHHARIRLGWTLLAIIIISLVEGIPSSFLIGLQADSVLNTCNNFYQADKLVEVTVFTSIDSIVWSIVLILDPLASIVFDHNILNKVNHHYVDTIETLIFWLNLVIPFILLTLGLFLNAYFLVVLIPEFRKMTNTTKKQYVFVVSRGISSLSAASSMLLIRIIEFFSLNYGVYFLFFMIDDLSFYTLLGSYVGSAILLYLATVRPIFYSLRISLRTVYYFAAADWIFSIILSASTAVFQAAEQSNGSFECDVQHCQPVINIVMFVIISISFIIPIITLSFVLISVCCYKNRAESVGSLTSDSSVFNSARTRLAWTLFTFTLISLSEAIPASYMVGLKIDGNITTCTNFYQANNLILPAIMSSSQVLAWSIALIVDPLCGLLFDPRIRKVWIQHITNLKTFLLVKVYRPCCCYTNMPEN